MSFREIVKTNKSTILEFEIKNSNGENLSVVENPDNLFGDMKKALERELIREAQKGNKKATEKLVDSLTGYIYKTVEKTIFNEEMKVEGFNCAVMGLLKAIKTFNADKGCSLITYARTFIQKELIVFLKFELSIKKKRFTSRSNNTEIEVESYSLNYDEIEMDESHNRALEVIDVNFENVENSILLSDCEGGLLRNLNDSEKDIVKKLMNGENITKISKKDDGSINWQQYRKTHQILNKLRREVI